MFEKKTNVLAASLRLKYRNM